MTDTDIKTLKDQLALEQKRVKELEAQAEIDNKGNQEWIDDLCKQLCQMEDALGFKEDQHDKQGQWVPTIGPWLERVRDLIAAEGELGDLRQRVKELEADKLALEDKGLRRAKMLLDEKQALETERDQLRAELGKVQGALLQVAGNLNLDASATVQQIVDEALKLRAERDELRRNLDKFTVHNPKPDRMFIHPDEDFCACGHSRQMHWHHEMTASGDRCHMCECIHFQQAKAALTESKESDATPGSPAL